MATKQHINERFIEMVKCYPVLYDTSHPDYKNIFMKNTIWDEIGQKLYMSGDDAKVKWKNLRDSYSKYLKGQVNTGQNVSKSYIRYSKWQWASLMEFLKDFMGIALTETNLSMEIEVVNETGAQNDSESQLNSENETFAPGSRTAPFSVRTSRKRTSIIELPRVKTYLNSNADKLSPTELLMLRYAKTDCERSNSENGNFAPESKTALPGRTATRKRKSGKEHPVEKVTTYLNSNVDKLSPTELIMLGYAKTIDGFSKRRKIISKMRIAQVIMEAELEEEQEQERTSLRSYRTDCPSTSQETDSDTNNYDPRSAFPIQEDPLSPSQNQFESLDLKEEIDDIQN